MRLMGVMVLRFGMSLWAAPPWTASAKCCIRGGGGNGEVEEAPGAP